LLLNNKKNVSGENVGELKVHFMKKKYKKLQLYFTKSNTRDNYVKLVVSLIVT